MDHYLPKDVQDALDAARRTAKTRRNGVRVVVGDQSWPVLRRWDRGFAVDPALVPPLRGLVELHDGPKLLFSCLIVASAEEEGAIHYEFKRATPAADRPPVDFVRPDDSPVALIGPR